METRRALDLSVQEVIYAGLEALEAVTPLEVCAYLNISEPAGTQLFLGAPSLAAAGGEQAFEIFSTLRGALDRPRHRLGLPPGDGRMGEAVEVCGMSTFLVVTGGAASRGVHAIGRQRPLGAREGQALVHLATALGTSVHRLQAAMDPLSSRP